MREKGGRKECKRELQVGGSIHKCRPAVLPGVELKAFSPKRDIKSKRIYAGCI